MVEIHPYTNKRRPEDELRTDQNSWCTPVQLKYGRLAIGWNMIEYLSHCAINKVEAHRYSLRLYEYQVWQTMIVWKPYSVETVRRIEVSVTMVGSCSMKLLVVGIAAVGLESSILEFVVQKSTHPRF